MSIIRNRRKTFKYTLNYAAYPHILKTLCPVVEATLMDFQTSKLSDFKPPEEIRIRLKAMYTLLADILNILNKDDISGKHCTQEDLYGLEITCSPVNGNFTAYFNVKLSEDRIQPLKLVFFPYDGKTRLIRDIQKPSLCLDKEVRIDKAVSNICSI